LVEQAVLGRDGRETSLSGCIQPSPQPRARLRDTPMLRAPTERGRHREAGKG
jgi:hypothetical protein